MGSFSYQQQNLTSWCKLFPYATVTGETKGRIYGSSFQVMSYPSKLETPYAANSDLLLRNLKPSHVTHSSRPCYLVHIALQTAFRSLKGIQFVGLNMCEGI